MRYSIHWSYRGGDATCELETDSLDRARECLANMQLRGGDAAWIWDNECEERIAERERPGRDLNDTERQDLRTAGDAAADLEYDALEPESAFSVRALPGQFSRGAARATLNIIDDNDTDYFVEALAEAEAIWEEAYTAQWDALMALP